MRETTTCRINAKQLCAVAAFLKRQGGGKNSFDYCAPTLPRVNEKCALDFFFVTCLNQYGFWYQRNQRYVRPMYLKRNGTTLKGSDYLWASFLAFYRANKPPLAYWATVRRADFTAMLKSDDGQQVPEVQSHWELTRAFAREMTCCGLLPAEVLRRCNSAKKPLAMFYRMVGGLPGYREDPLLKKLGLLAYVLRVRPEQFLRMTEEKVKPIIDYHIQRMLLRLGTIDVPPRLREKLVARAFLAKREEEAVRRAAYRAFARLSHASGLSTEQLDFAIFKVRKICAEIGTPDCPGCPYNRVCARRTDLFQPVRITTYY